MLFELEVFFFSYLVGSLPTAYIAVKRKSNIDIRSAGSGNVGSMNAYEVTGARTVGIIVLLVDVVKGAIAPFVTITFFSPEPLAVSVAILGVVVGHCWPVWLKFKGGRGLAAAAGAMLVADWIFVLLWLACWGVGYFVSKNIHVRNAIAIVVSALLAWFVPNNFVLKTTLAGFTTLQIVSVYTVMSCVLLIRHLEPLRELMVPITKNGN